MTLYCRMSTPDWSATRFAATSILLLKAMTTAPEVLTSVAPDRPHYGRAPTPPHRISDWRATR